jgi:hypothetical protein
VYKKLKARGVDMSAFTGADCLGDYLGHLTDEEQSNLKKWLGS